MLFLVNSVAHLKLLGVGTVDLSIVVCVQGCEKVLNELQTKFSDMKIISLSGNFCTDKKPAAINWSVLQLDCVCACCMCVCMCVCVMTLTGTLPFLGHHDRNTNSHTLCL